MSRFKLPQGEKPVVSQDALQEFAAGAKEHRTTQALPWETHQPDAPPCHNVTVRLNDYQLEMLRYLAKRTDVSQQKVMHRILVPALENRVKEVDLS